MFDAQTSRLIRAAPELPGLDREALPQALTRAYARIATTRLRIAEEGVESAAAGDPDFSLLRRLANTYETYTAALIEPQTQRSAAFVSASAHQLLARAAVLEGRVGRSPWRLTPWSISSDVSAMLLFVIAGYPSDARDVAQSYSTRRDDTPAERLLECVVHLARGNLQRAVQVASTVGQVGSELLVDGPVDTLWNELIGAVGALASSLLGTVTVEGARERAASTFRYVQEVSVRRVEIPELQAVVAAGDGVYSTYAGPHHLATLLLLVTDQLLELSVSSVPPPPGVPPQEWRQYTSSVATTRPYLWDNHADAVAKGYLTPGTSAVITFPTGAGKSTLSELKIASTLLTGRSVIFLAPTRALVWQVYRNLTEAFPEYDVRRSLLSDGAYTEIEGWVEAQISVMTPEKCLSGLSSGQLSLQNLGLLVFDECHLVHPKRGTGDRRSLDAMLCLLHVLDRAPTCDLLLMSAMMSNSGEFAAWLGEVTSRPCIPLSLDWRPTRQARGCVVFDRERVEELYRTLQSATKTRKGHLSAETRRGLTAQPYGLFGLTHSWQRQLSPEQFTLVPLASSAVALSLGKEGLTSNKNEVAAALAAKLAGLKAKTIVFVQNKAHCLSVARAIASRVDNPSFRLSAPEERLFAAAAEDLGGNEYVLGPVAGIAAPHNGWLLPSERLLNESTFRRRQGVHVLVATPTLAQGMNLPAETVIIAGDSRFDKQSLQHKQLSAHELLNAAGRAGRAGQASAGLALIIPDRVVATDERLNDADGPFASLTSNVFSKPDQCLEVADPIEFLLDRLQTGAGIRDRLVRYFVTRFPLDERDEDIATATRRLLSRSLAAYHAHRRGQTAQYAQKLTAALRLQRELSELPERVIWLDRVASECGMGSPTIRGLHRAIESNPIRSDISTAECIHWMFAWIASNRDLVLELIDPGALEAALTDEEWKAVKNGRTDPVLLLPDIERRLRRWTTGITLRELEDELRGSKPHSPHCNRAREFADQVTLAFSYIAGAITRVLRGRIEHGEEAGEMPLALASLSACIREGMDGPEKLALWYQKDPSTSRVACHREYAAVSSRISTATHDETFEDTLRRVKEVFDE
jgi:superfamily II DNA/RNA helicase